MMHSEPGDITLLFSALPADPAAEEKLMPLIYGELRRIAGAYFRNERRNHTLQPTALIHEAFIRMAKSGPWKNRQHFFGVAAIVMRRVLVEYARTRAAAKRGGLLERVDLDETLAYEPQKSNEILALNDALERLEKLDARQSRIVELRFFGGLSLEETAEILGVGISTVKSDWTLAKSWLRRELDENV